MKNTTLKISIVLSLLLLAMTALAKSKRIMAKSFSKLQTTVNALGAENLPRTLVVMDDDDTLTMMSCPDQGNAHTCQYLGGPAWYSWQEQLISTQSHYKVADNSDELINISALLLAMNNMNYTQELIPRVLHDLTESGVKLLVLTARGGSDISATVSQFSNLKQPFAIDPKENFLTFINDNALLGMNSNLASLASPFQPADCLASRSISYQQGVMYVAGQNKGHMLKCLLKRTQSTLINNIVFIDDTLQNVKDVRQAFKNDCNYNVIAIHYTALKKHKIALTKGSNAAVFQAYAHQQWEKIKATLKNQLQAPAAID
jgi:hypothetical protein